MGRSSISKEKQERLLEHFVASTTARYAGIILGVNKTTATYYFHRLREIIHHALEQETKLSVAGEIEVDECYCAGHRKGKRGKGAAAKTPVFGLLKRDGQVYTKVITDSSGRSLMPIIKQKVIPDS